MNTYMYNLHAHIVFFCISGKVGVSILKPFSFGLEYLTSQQHCLISFLPSQHALLFVGNMCAWLTFSTQLLFSPDYCLYCETVICKLFPSISPSQSSVE